MSPLKKIWHRFESLCLGVCQFTFFYTPNRFSQGQNTCMAELQTYETCLVNVWAFNFLYPVIEFCMEEDDLHKTFILLKSDLVKMGYNVVHQLVIDMHIT